MTKHIVAVDLANVYDAPKGGKIATTFAWGDAVEVTKKQARLVTVSLTLSKEQPDGSFKPAKTTGYVRIPKGISVNDVLVAPDDRAAPRVLKVDFVDVQQGDGTVIETPDGQVLLIDGGDNQLFARYCAARFKRHTARDPQPIAAIVVTHGDADHFSGLTEIFKSQTNKTPSKRLFIHPDRVFHNGLVKRPSKLQNGKSRRDIDLLGPTKKAANGRRIATGLVDDLLGVPDKDMNAPFLAWKKALKAWRRNGSIAMQRLAQGSHAAFDFLRPEGVEVEVLGPVVTNGGLLFLGDPPKGPRIGREAHSLDGDGFKGFSASHTINGHSIVLRLTYGQFSFLFAGDLNDQAERALTSAHNQERLNLRAEVFKVPHHGSADFSAAFVEAVSPVVSVVSSGDESARKEYMHPRATLMGALGRYSRMEEPLVFVTELVAFFNKEGYSSLDDRKKRSKRGSFFAFSRTAFGIVKVRVCEDRLLVYTNSGVAKLKEAYAFRMTTAGEVRPDEVIRV